MEHVMRNKMVMVLAVLVTMVGVGCGSDTTEGTDNPATNAGAETLPEGVDWEALQLVYSPMYSAFDGGAHVYSLPCYANGVSTQPEDWIAIPSDAVVFEPWTSGDGNQSGVLITIARYEPKVTIAVANGAAGGKADLFITNATTEQWQVGQDRYVKGQMFDFEAVQPMLRNSFMFDGMSLSIDGASLDLPTDLRCDSCHTAEAQYFQVEHTPTQAARFSDDELVKIFSMGTKPEGTGYRALPGPFQELYGYFHTWDVTQEEAVGMTIYLRSLPPRGQGEIMLPGLSGVGFTADQLANVPDACNPTGANFDLATCTSMLGPECQMGTPEFDLQACVSGLGIELPPGFADFAGMFGGGGFGQMDGTMMDDTTMDDTTTTDAGMMDDTTMDDTTTDAGMGM